MLVIERQRVVAAVSTDVGSEHRGVLHNSLAGTQPKSILATHQQLQLVCVRLLFVIQWLKWHMLMPFWFKMCWAWINMCATLLWPNTLECPGRATSWEKLWAEVETTGADPHFSHSANSWHFLWISPSLGCMVSCVTPFTAMPSKNTAPCGGWDRARVGSLLHLRNVHSSSSGLPDLSSHQRRRLSPGVFPWAASCVSQTPPLSYAF